MQTYSTFRPTQFDVRGLALPEQQHWLVAPVIQTRDASPLERANFDATLKALGGESETVEVHRFGHWGPGWYEIIVIDSRDTARVAIAQDIEHALSDYPVVDEELYSRYEDNYCKETWEHCYNVRERIDYFRRHSFTSQGIASLLRAMRGSWYDAANMLHCPSDLLS